MKKSLLALLTGLMVVPLLSQAQMSWEAAHEYLNVNNINARLNSMGDMWWDPATGEPSCEFPKGSGKNIGFAGGLWMAGYDAGGVLKVAAQTYRQSGNDYWPGPIDGAASTDINYSQKWAKVWKIDKTMIDSFLAQSNHTLASTPAAILTWPAKGNINAAGYNGASLSVNDSLAPFIDVNNDGVYNALTGDYPKLKGDQMLWYVFSDYGPSHTQTNSDPLQVEVRVSAYAYQRNTAIDDIVYYEYEVINKGASNLDSFRMALWTDFDLGNFSDDFIGFDSSRSLGIGYNGDNFDGNGQTMEYGNMIPVAGVRVLESLDGVCTSLEPAGSFMYYNNMDPNPALTDPQTKYQFNNYMRSRWATGQHLTNDYAGPGVPSIGYGGSVETNYVFDGNPADTSQWSECMSGNLPGDRRFVIATNDHQLQKGIGRKFSFALMATRPDTGNACDVAGKHPDFAAIKALSDTAQHIYCNPLSPLPTGINDIDIKPGRLHLYPNPATNIMNIAGIGSGAKLALYDAVGREVFVPVLQAGPTTTIDIRNLVPGLYHVSVAEGQKFKSGHFIKE